MSMEINSAYSSVYESTYTAKKSETEKQQTVSKDSADKTKQAGSVKNAYETKTSASQTTDEYLRALRQKYPNVNITVADFSNLKQRKAYMFSCSGGNNIAISSSVLEKMASNPAAAEKYEKTIAEVPELGERFKREIEAMGGEQIASGTVIDKDGNITYWGISRAKPVENPGTVYKEKVQKQLEEKRAKKKEEEKNQEQKAEKIIIKERQQEARIAIAETKEELLNKFKTNEADEIPADITEEILSKENTGSSIDYLA